MKGFFILGLFVSPALVLAQAKQDSVKEKKIEAIVFTKRLPVSKEIISVTKDLDRKNLGQDLPILLKNQTSIVSTSDAGNGIGYTGFRIRGVGGTSINVMMNGVPYNDSESQGTFFVDVPDLTSSASQIVIQRGVGTSTNGVSAFGASVNVISKDPEQDFYLKSDNSVGSFNTYKYSAEVGSGKFWKDRLSVMARYTKIHSDGYIDRAFSNLDSYNFTALFEEQNTKLRFMAFGGKEKTYQAWNGIDKQTWETNPKFNFAGAIYNNDWSEIINFYDNETDNYKQNHYQLLWTQQLTKDWSLETTLHYTKGKGFYENYKQDAKFSKYNLPNQGTISRSDFIRKKWLDNDFYGVVSTLYGTIGDLKLNLGLVGNQYYGRHFGRVTGVFFPQISEHEYYRNFGLKNEISGFAKGIYKLGKFELFADMQLRNIDYQTHIALAGDDEGANLNNQWTFFNPKAGINYNLPQGKIYASYANASREPNRDDLITNPNTQAESLHDFEFGVEKNIGQRVSLSANAYYMRYINQLVLSGQINNIGEFIRTNSGKSYRLGIEVSALAKINQWLDLSGNVTWSDNKNINFRKESASGIEFIGNTPIAYSPNVIANAMINIKPINQLSFGIQNQYVGKQYLDNTNNSNLTLDAYYLTDFNAQYTINWKNNDINLKLLINNIFNKKYTNNGYVYENTPYVFAQAGTHYLLGISLKFKK